MIGKRTIPSLTGDMDFERCPECGETKLIRDHDSAEIAEVTEVTMRNRYKELVDNMTFLMEL